VAVEHGAYCIAKKERVGCMAKHVRGIYKRGKIFWICYKNGENRVVRESARTDDHKKAEALLALRRTGAVSEEGCEKEIYEDCLLRELAGKYHAFAASQKSYYIKKIIINQLAVKFGAIKISDFTTAMVDSYLSEALQQGLKPATVNRRLACLKHMFRKAWEWGYCSGKKLRQIRQARFLVENNQRVRYLEPEECQALVHVCERYPRLKHLKPIIVTALNTGMRRGEILSLRWEQVDFKKGLISFEVEPGEEKRKIPINESLAETLRGIERSTESPYVFVDSQGNQYKHIREAFASACRKIGIQDFRFQDLRHTFACHLVKAGIEIATVAKLLGHKSQAMTVRYAHLAPDQMKAAVNTLNVLTMFPSPPWIQGSSVYTGIKRSVNSIA